MIVYRQHGTKIGRYLKHSKSGCGRPEMHYLQLRIGQKYNLSLLTSAYSYLWTFNRSFRVGLCVGSGEGRVVASS